MPICLPFISDKPISLSRTCSQVAYFESLFHLGEKLVAKLNPSCRDLILYADVICEPSISKRRQYGI